MSEAAGGRLRSIEIVEDLTAQSRCDEGFLRLRRLRLRNLYQDGTGSAIYPCDVLSRPGSDAVVAVLYEIDGARRVRVLLRDAPRAPVYLRSQKRFVHPDPRVYLSLMELVAGMVEEADGPGDTGRNHGRIGHAPSGLEPRPYDDVATVDVQHERRLLQSLRVRPFQYDRSRS